MQRGGDGRVLFCVFQAQFALVIASMQIAKVGLILSTFQRLPDTVIRGDLSSVC
jgi:hypothetical protein